MHAIVVDGHDVNAIMAAFAEAKATKGKPTCILAQTFKGKFFPEGIEDSPSWHGKPLGAHSDKVIAHVKSLIKNPTDKLAYELLEIPKPTCTIADNDVSNLKLSCAPEYKKGEKVATRFAYGTALIKLGKNNPSVVALDGEVKNSTYSIRFRDAYPDKFIECFIAEQNLAGITVGVTCRDRTVAFASTFAAFWSRAFDQVRMGAISCTNSNFVGSHVGVSIGEDGASQMALEDLAMFRSVAGSTVFYPCDAVATERAVELAANTKGVCYIRCSRPANEVVYDNDEEFKVGKVKVVGETSSSDVCTIIGGGVTLHEALKAAAALKAEGVNVRVIDVFCVKPLDWQTILVNALQTKHNIITVEDHYFVGGIGESVAFELCKNAPGVAFNIKNLYVHEVPYSGKPHELLERFEIDSKAIMKAAKSF